MPGRRSTPEMIAPRVAFAKTLFATPDAYRTYVARIVAAYGVCRSTACDYLAQAREELGDAIPLSDDRFDAMFIEQMLEIVFDPATSAGERRRTLCDLARFKGRFKQISASEALVPSADRVDLSDPAVLEAQLALDRAVEKSKIPG